MPATSITLQQLDYNRFNIIIGQHLIKIRPATITINGKRFATWWDAEERTEGEEREALLTAKNAYRERRAEMARITGIEVNA